MYDKIQKDMLSMIKNNVILTMAISKNLHIKNIHNMVTIQAKNNQYL